MDVPKTRLTIRIKNVKLLVNESFCQRRMLFLGFTYICVSTRSDVESVPGQFLLCVFVYVIVQQTDSIQQKGATLLSDSFPLTSGGATAQYDPYE